MAWCKTSAFIAGVDLPVNMSFHEIVASAGNLYTIGNKYGSNNKDIFKFECNNSIKNCSWSKIQTKVQYGRQSTVAMTIPNALSDKLCN